MSDRILAETARNIVRDTPGLTAEHLEKTFAAMWRAFPDAVISGYEPLVEAMTKHPKDRHVLAAAVAAQADVVVTANLRHFPPQSGDSHGIHIKSPDQFLCDALQRQPDVVAAALRAQAARKRQPPTHVRRRDARSLGDHRSPIRHRDQAPRAPVNIASGLTEPIRLAAQAQRSTTPQGAVVTTRARVRAMN